jgi:protein TonB
MRLGQKTGAGLNSSSLAISLGLHLALAALVLFWVGSHKPLAPPVLTVSLVAPDPGQPGPGQGPAPAGVQGEKPAPPGAPPAQLKKETGPPPRVKEKPRKPKAPSLSRTEPEEFFPPIPLRPVTPSVAKAPVTPPPAPSPALSTVPGVPRGGSSTPVGQSREGAGSGSGSAGTVSAGLGLGSGDGAGGGGGGGRNPVEAQRQYLNVVRTRILAKRHYPPLARQRREEGVVRLRFTLSPGGALAQGVQMVKPSGSQLLDDQAQQCVLAASPFPPFPPDLKRDCLTVEVPIVYKLTELGM